jgi:hypothetical protein
MKLLMNKTVYDISKSVICIVIGNQKRVLGKKSDCVIVQSTVGGKWRNGYKYCLYAKSNTGKYRHVNDLTGRLYDARTFQSTIFGIETDLKAFGLKITMYKNLRSEAY